MIILSFTHFMYDFSIAPIEYNLCTKFHVYIPSLSKVIEGGWILNFWKKHVKGFIMNLRGLATCCFLIEVQAASRMNNLQGRRLYSFDSFRLQVLLLHQHLNHHLLWIQKFLIFLLSLGSKRKRISLHSFISTSAKRMNVGTSATTREMARSVSMF